MNSSIIIETVFDNSLKLRIMRMLETSFSATDSARHTADLYRKICDKAIFIAAFLNSCEVGYCAMYANDKLTHNAYITMLAVETQYQGKSIGTNLLEQAFNVAKECGMTSVSLEVSMNNNLAISFYLKNGFTIEKTSNCGFFMKKELA